MQSYMMSLFGDIAKSINENRVAALIALIP